MEGQNDHSAARRLGEAYNTFGLSPYFNTDVELTIVTGFKEAFESNHMWQHFNPKIAEDVSNVDNWKFEGALEPKFLEEVRARVEVVEALMDARYRGYHHEVTLPKIVGQPYIIEVMLEFS